MNVKEFQESTKFNKFYINSQNIRSPNVKARGLWVNVLGLFYSVLTKWLHLAYRFSFFPWDAIFIWGLRKASILFPVLFWLEINSACGHIMNQKYSGMFRPFHAFVSATTISFHLYHLSFERQSRGTKSRFRGNVHLGCCLLESANPLFTRSHLT